MAPNLHWPDTMFSYDHGTGVMYTCDGEGSRQATVLPPGWQGCKQRSIRPVVYMLLPVKLYPLLPRLPAPPPCSLWHALLLGGPV